MKVRWRYSFLSVIGLVGFLAGCAQFGLEYAPKGPWLYYHKELPAADRAVEAARTSGKDRECPDEFGAAEKLKNDAYATYWACHTKEAIAMANDAASRANALCPRKAELPPPAAPPPPPAPTVSLSASPSTIQAGQCTTLTWSSTNTTDAVIDSGVGAVAPSGSKEVCPKDTIGYGITAKGPGGSATGATVVIVTPAPTPPPPIAAAPPSPPAPQPAERLTLHINFDTDKAVIRPADRGELQKAIDFVKQHPGRKILIEGHTDNTGTAKYNQGLSERRAAAVKDYLLKNGVPDGGRMTTVGYGLTKPVASNATKDGRFQNRRVEIVVVPE